MTQIWLALGTNWLKTRSTLVLESCVCVCVFETIVSYGTLLWCQLVENEIASICLDVSCVVLYKNWAANQLISSLSYRTDGQASNRRKWKPETFANCSECVDWIVVSVF